MKFKDKEPFVRMELNEEKRRDTFTVAINKDERTLLESMKIILEQEKDSTAIKQLAWIGSKVLQEQKTSFILETIYSNKRRNKRIGVNQFEL